MDIDTQIESLVERLAEIEHERWSDWQAWCHKILRENCPSPELEAVLERWDRQIATPYKDLSEQEKQSDRDQVDRYLPAIKALLIQQQGGLDKPSDTASVGGNQADNRCVDCGKDLSRCENCERLWQT